jgi:hypothetical protein
MSRPLFLDAPQQFRGAGDRDPSANSRPCIHLGVGVLSPTLVMFSEEAPGFPNHVRLTNASLSNFLVLRGHPAPDSAQFLCGVSGGVPSFFLQFDSSGSALTVLETGYSYHLTGQELRPVWHCLFCGSWWSLSLRTHTLDNDVDLLS